ncbi:hypothetical protein Q427_05325 [Halomonas sp. BC04]|nr:hypothetical protein Q427_05325 [Halomonas sp. BC04]
MQLARIAENVDPLAFEFGMGELDGAPEIEGAGLLLAEAEADTDTDEEIVGDPTAGPASISLAESSLLSDDQQPIDGPTPMALAFGSGFTSVTATGSLDFSFGPLGAGSIGFASMDGETLTIGQESFILDWDVGSNTLTASNERVQESNAAEPFLFQVEIDPQTGEFTVTLANNLLHEEGTDEALASLVYTVTDAGGNTASSSLEFTIVDDSPSVDVTQAEDLEGFTLTTSDADLTPLFEGGGGETGPRDQAPSEVQPQLLGYGLDEDQTDSLVNSRDLAKFFNATIEPGADGLASVTWTYALGLKGSGEGPVDSGLESGGNTVYLHEVEGPDGGMAIIGSTDFYPPNVESNDPSSIVFALFIDSDGETQTITLQQFQAIDHPEGIEPGQSISLSSELISLTGSVVVVDNDGDVDEDSGVIDIGGLLNFVDDGPEVALEGAMEAVEGGEEVTGTWSTESGGDEVGAERLISINGGDEQVLVFEDGSASFDTPQGTLALIEDGTWVFVPGTNLDHGDVEAVDFSFKLIKIDGDLDRVSATHTIAIIDGEGPKPGDTSGEGGSVTIELDEAQLRDSEATSKVSELAFTAGSDDITSFEFASLDAMSIDIDGLALEKYDQVEWTLQNGSLVLLLDGESALELSLSGDAIAAGESGVVDVNVTLLSNLLHGEDLDKLTISGIEVMAVDADGTKSKDPATIEVRVDDDAPDVSLWGWPIAREGGMNIWGRWSSESGADEEGAVRQVSFNGGELQDFVVGQTYELNEGTLTFFGNGFWRFEPGTNMDHSAGKVTLNIELRKTDGDGDVATATHTIWIKDGAGPIPGGEGGEGGDVFLVVNERGLREDADTDKLSDTADLIFTAGSDDIASFVFGNTDSITVDGLDGDRKLTWHEVDGELIGRLDNEDVLKLSLSGETIAAGESGSVSVMVELLSNLPHGEELDKLTLSGIEVIAIDKDGTASAPGTVGVQVDDDIPSVEGIDPSGHELTVTNLGSAAGVGYDNSFGYYIKDENGNPTVGKVIWSNVKDDPSATYTLEGFAPGEVGYFIIPNGSNNNPDLKDETEVEFIQVENPDGVLVWVAVPVGSTDALEGEDEKAPVLFSDASLHPDGSSHVENNAEEGDLNWEDIYGDSSDRDYNDVNINVSWAPANLTVDEAELDVTAKFDFSSYFTAEYGADGLESRDYSLSVAENGADSGLVDTQTGETVFVKEVVGGDIVGYIMIGNDEEAVFTLGVDSDTGIVTLDQIRAVEHPLENVVGESDPVNILSGVVFLAKTVTDGDGDEASAVIDIGQVIYFLDDGPSADDATFNEVNIGSEDSYVILAEDALTALGIEPGADGFASEDAVVFGSGSEGGTLHIDDQGRLLYTPADGHGYGELTEEFTYTVTDGDGDSVSQLVTINVQLIDDVPPIADPVLTSAELYTESDTRPDGVETMPLFFRTFTVGGGVDEDEKGKTEPTVLEGDPSLGGKDNETHEDDLVFTLTSLPSYGTLYLATNSGGTFSEAGVGDEFSTSSELYWAIDSSDAATAGTERSLDFNSGSQASDWEGYGVSIYSYGFYGQQDNDLLSFHSNGMGVDDGAGLQDEVPEQLAFREGFSQTIVVDFSKPSMNVEVSIGNLIVDEGEVGRVEAWLDGEQVGSWTFSGIKDAKLNGDPIDLDTGGSHGSFSLPTGVVFDQLRFTAAEYADGYSAGSDSTDSSDYFIAGISWNELAPANFEYSVTDEAGNTSDSVQVLIDPMDTNTDVPDSFDVPLPPPSITGLSDSDVTVDEAFLSNGTRSGEGDPVDSGKMTLVSVAGVRALWIQGESASSAGGGPIDGVEVNPQSGYVEISIDALNDSESNPIVIGTGEGNALIVDGYDSDTGEVSYTFKLAESVDHPDGQDDDATLDKKGIDVILVDTNDAQTEPGANTINVTIIDDGVKAKDDTEQVDTGSYVKGDVLENDKGADQDLSLTQVVYEGETYTFTEGSEFLNIETGGGGTLVIDRDGGFKFTAKEVTPVSVPSNSLADWQSGTEGLWGFGVGNSPLSDNGLNTGALNQAAASDVRFNPGAKAGIGAWPQGSSGKTDNNETLVIKLKEPAFEATFGVNQFNAAQTEDGKWFAFDAEGNQVASGVFQGEDQSGFEILQTVSSETPFSYLAFSLDTSETNNAGYVVSGLNYVPSSLLETEEFVYTVVDADGSTDEATLTINLNALDAGVPETPDAPPVPEATVDVGLEIDFETVTVPGSFENLGSEEPVGGSGDNNMDSSKPGVDSGFATLDFGASKAGQVVKVSWTHQAFGGWEDGVSGRGGTEDKFEVFANGELLEKFNYYDPKNEDDTEFDKEQPAFNVVLDDDGRAHLEFRVTSTHVDEIVNVFDIQGSLESASFVYPVTLSGSIDEGSIETYLVEVEGGTLVQNGNPLTPNGEGIYELNGNDIDNLQVRPDEGADNINVKALAISDQGMQSAWTSGNVGVETLAAFDNSIEATITLTEVPQDSVDSTPEDATFDISGSGLRRGSESGTHEINLDVPGDGTGNLSFTVVTETSSGLTGSSTASLTWEVLDENGDSIDGGGPFTGNTSELETIDLAPGSYTLKVSGNVSWTTFHPASAAISDLKLMITPPPEQVPKADPIFGNVISSPADDEHPDVRPANADLQILNGDTFKGVSLGETEVVEGRFGLLEIGGNGEYTYTPYAEAANIGGVETFTYQLVQPNVNQAQANLTIRIDSPNMNVQFGSGGDDELEGTGGVDVLVGGAGDDTLTGGAGDDVFRWNFGDQGDSNSPANDIVTDFGNGNNTLDIADLLQGENENNIGDFVMAEQEGADTVLYLSSDGSLAGSKDNADQTIRLEGKSFTDFGAAPGDSTDLISKMIESGQLHIDQ